MEFITLRNGMEVSAVGLGTYKMRPHQIMRVVPKLEATGITLIDTAHDYKNESWLGISSKCNANHNLVFSTKMSVGQQRNRTDVCSGGGYTKQLFLQSLKKLRCKKMGMYLLHFPYPDTYLDCWHDMEKLYREGLVGCIGVCNCHIHHLKYIIDNSEIVPFVNQVECHPYLAQEELLQFCKENGIQMEAYSPFARNLPDMIYNPILQTIAKAHKKSVQQIILRWNYQRGVISLPKSSGIERLKENTDIFDFSLDSGEMEMIKSLDKGFRIRFNPDTVDYNIL